MSCYLYNYYDRTVDCPRHPLRMPKTPTTAPPPRSPRSPPARPHVENPNHRLDRRDPRRPERHDPRLHARMPKTPTTAPPPRSIPAAPNAMIPACTSACRKPQPSHPSGRERREPRARFAAAKAEANKRKRLIPFPSHDSQLSAASRHRNLAVTPPNSHVLLLLPIMA